MKQFHFSKKYFNSVRFEDASVTVKVTERPSFDVFEEEYSLRVMTTQVVEQLVHREYAIEQHHKPKHDFPHSQFHFHTEEIGTFWIMLEFKDSKEYETAILGFIYKMKGVLRQLEKHSSGISEKILVLELVDGLSEQGKFLEQKIGESIARHSFELAKDGMPREKLNKLRNNPLLVEFLGEKNIAGIVGVKEQK